MASLFLYVQLFLCERKMDMYWIYYGKLNLKI